MASIKEIWKLFLIINLFGVSVKKGSGNSVHQERVEEFISFLNTIEPVSNELSNALKMFIWGDGTLDGSGKIENRTKNVSLDYPDEIKIIQNYFSKNAEKIIYRVLISGAYGDKVDYIYYGEYDNGVWCKALDAVKYLASHVNSRATINIGNLTFQAWNRATFGGKSEKKRGQIQLKWASIFKDILMIRKEYLYNE